MATYFVSSSGANTAPYSSWSTAATSLATALAAASTSGDIVVVQYNGVPSTDSALSATTTYTPTANINIIAASNDGGTSYTPTPMWESYWIGHSTLSRGISFAGSFSVYMYGITLRCSETTAVTLSIATGDNSEYTLDNCYLWQENVASSSVIRLGPSGSNSIQSIIKLRSCKFRLANGNTAIKITTTVEMENCSYFGLGHQPSTIISGSSTSDAGGCSFTAIGCDFSYASSGAALVGNVSTPILDYKFIQCKFPTSYVNLSTQTIPNKSSARIWIYDCSSGDTHGIMEYADALGSVVVDTGIYYTGSPAGVSWKVVTSSYCSDIAVFETPWIDFYNTATSNITPRLEILRDGSTTAYTDNEVWANFFVKNTSGTTKSTLFTDRVTLTGTPANQATGAGLSSWSGENATAWSGKVDTGAAVTPAEVGMIRARLCVGIPSATVYVDPYIRTA